MAAADAAGLFVMAEDLDSAHAEYGCTRVMVEGAWYEIELRGDTARAILVD